MIAYGIDKKWVNPYNSIMICVTGRRWSIEMDSLKLDSIRSQIDNFLVIKLKEGHRSFGSGGAMGADLTFFYCVQKLKIEYLGIVNSLYIPFQKQAKRYTPYYKYWWEKAIEQCDNLVAVDEIMNLAPLGEYRQGKYFARNKLMVDESSHVLAIWDGKKRGGTWSTITYAQSKNKDVEIIYV